MLNINIRQKLHHTLPNVLDKSTKKISLLEWCLNVLHLYSLCTLGLTQWNLNSFEFICIWWYQTFLIILARLKSFYIMKKVWYHQIWIQNYLCFIVLILFTKYTFVFKLFISSWMTRFLHWASSNLSLRSWISSSLGCKLEEYVSTTSGSALKFSGC